MPKYISKTEYYDVENGEEIEKKEIHKYHKLKKHESYKRYNRLDTSGKPSSQTIIEKTIYWECRKENGEQLRLL